ncbi:glycoside hydrolase family 127 protein [Belliella sp. DSM 111904]|uniref:Glycoside hydrolase family 127 protein n=1 Tax=Belliella filtrata TaxID=2923435 RepID=A0ABS9UWB1_9BACT|nr:glycoside hydrolase family 127 protein [Belliella filtrata]MCH7408098.1 glycoside hydrolase family 127 protein [Belliella filtrata]
MNKNALILTLGILGSTCFASDTFGQQKALVNTDDSPFAKLKSVNMQDVKWTGGFWKERFDVTRDKTIPFMWSLYHDAEINHAVRNFEIAAGQIQGEFKGPSFHDGDFYKVFEAMASLYAVTKDKDIDKEMDRAIALIKKAQREDGYLHTPLLIEERWGTLGPEEVQKQLSFEKYNMGHLMTAACVHYRATGKDNFLNVAIGVADFLYDFYKDASPELARNAICPSHYMGVTEMYRTTRDPKYLELSQNLIDIRGKTEDGTDDNQDRSPFRDQKVAMGHAVRATYLYAGVADLYAETGEDILLENLLSIWEDVVFRKMYVNGGCGALYDGVSPDGTSYDPTLVQKTHQSFGRAYQLPHASAHNETCANIGNMLWNWRMLQLTQDAKHTDVMELNFYNSILSGVSLQGTEFFYNNPLSAKLDFPYELRWPNTREGYISKSNCCAPNVARTLAQVNNYAYSISETGLFVNLFGSNSLNTRLPNGEQLSLSQATEYPWDETINLTIDKAPKDEFIIHMRIPGWCEKASLKVNGEIQKHKLESGTYVPIARQWRKGDQVELVLEMPVQFLASHPLVEESKNQLVVKRGPIVYCVESMDLPEGKQVDDLIFDTESEFTTEWMDVKGSKFLVLKGEAIFQSEIDWNKKLYNPLNKDYSNRANLTLIPYYAWANRGEGEMQVWMPFK